MPQPKPPEPKRSVFINCPFDDDFAPLLEAILFATVCCGFTPRTALESGTVSESRMERILKVMFTSKYSIHDLSRCKGEGEEGLARFNMPLELGMAMARRHMGPDDDQRHDWFVLVPEGHKYQKFISDLAAFDPATHNGKVEVLVPRVMFWLASRPEAISTPSPAEVLAALPAFQAKSQKAVKDWSGNVPWSLVLDLATQAAPKA